METLAQTLQNTAFARWIGESGSLLGYPTILFLHTIGLATLAGLNASINLRILGIAPGLPLAPLVRFYPTMWIAFGVTTASGLALLIADATTKLAQPVFYAKLLFVALAVINLQMLRTRVLADPAVDTRPPSGNAKALAATSFLFLLAATVAGRLIAYVY
jgi:hypothetical protein